MSLPGPSHAKRRREAENYTEDEDETSFRCNICLDAWTSNGEHQVTCLSCGHLFGKRCLMNWINQSRSCPTCRTPAVPTDIRPLFVPRIAVVERVRQESDVVGGPSGQIHTPVQPNTGQFETKFNLSFCQDARKSVFYYDESSDVIGIAGKYCGCQINFGVETWKDDKKLHFYRLHAKQIFDIRGKPEEKETVLTVSADNSAKVTCLNSGINVLSSRITGVTHCCWNEKNSNRFFVGNNEGLVTEFDLRFGTRPFQEVQNFRGCPIKGLQFMKNLEGSSLQGLVVASQGNLVLVETTSGGYVSHMLSHLDANVVDINVHPSGVFLGSYGPTDTVRKNKFEICTLKEHQMEGIPKNVHSVRRTYFEDEGHMLYCRNALISVQGVSGGLLACTADHNQNVSVYDESTKRKLQTIPCGDQPVDIQLTKAGELGVLTPSAFLLFTWVPGTVDEAVRAGVHQS